MFAMKRLSSVDVQEEYRNITDLCRRITNLQEQVLPQISGHSKGLLNGVLEQAKQELSSMISHILLLRREADELTKRSLAAHPKLEAFSLECETLKKQITELEQINNILIASQSQLKNDLMFVYQSKNQRIAELEDKLTKNNKINLTSKVVGYERELRAGLASKSAERNSKGEEIPTPSPETKLDANVGVHCHQHEFGRDERPNSGRFLSQTICETNSFKNPNLQDLRSSHKSYLPKQDPVSGNLPTSALTPESVQIAAKRTRDSEPIPARDFIVVSKVEVIDLIDKLLITNIPICDYGRVVGRKGKNVERLENTYGVKVSFVESQKDPKLFIFGGNAESRRVAADDIIGNLPIVVECPNLKLEISNREIKQINFDYHVQIIQPNFGNNGHFTIRGKMDNCQMAYRLLSNHAKLWYPK
ncbi:hypothetical protein GHT06_005771 [Daphnia sinensis]|uniref:K Homology domain-containing protein n=1 Tax=Daphnia sinensis TaxID=1820382 RepID=A0AAD5KVT6_9CRUS|nr:hypothetical protein GHT06_005771 [Daphnia sinensis]